MQLLLKTVLVLLSLNLLSAKAETEMLSNDCRQRTNEFRCLVYVQNYDGDTATFNIPSLPPVFGQKISVRIEGIDAPEMDSTSPCERQMAYKAQQVLEAKLKDAKSIKLARVQRDKYFRVLADLQVDDVSMGEYMLKKGLAVEYDGGTKAHVNWCHRN